VRLTLRPDAKLGWLVADVVRHLNAEGLITASTNFGILTNSATLKSKLDKVLGPTRALGSVFRFQVELALEGRRSNEPFAGRNDR
jgi:hypothetical protein